MRKVMVIRAVNNNASILCGIMPRNTGFNARWQSGQNHKFWEFGVRTKIGRSNVVPIPIFGGPTINAF